MSYFRTPFNYDGTSPTQVRDDLNKANMNFTTLSNTFVSNDPTTGVVKDSDKVDNYHASQTPTPNTIPVSGADGKLDINWLPQNINADKVDGFDTSVTSSPNTIPVSDSTGKLDVSWIPTNITVSNSDKLDNFHASQTPTPSTIPVANSDGKIDVNWLPPSVASLPYETYSKMYVGDEIPTNLQHGDLVYVITQNRLYRYDKRTGQPIEVDWKTIIESSPEWKSGRLRVNSTTGGLEISPDGSNWYECIPAVGSQAIELATVDNTSFSYKYWIAPGQTVVIKSANHVPIVYAKDVTPFFSGSVLHLNTYNLILGVRPSNVAISNGTVQTAYAYTTGVGASLSQNLSIVPVVDGSGVSPNWGDFEMRISTTNYFTVNSLAQASDGFSLIIYNSFGTASATSYWLGTWYTQGGQQFTMNNLTLTRRS